MNRSVKDTAHIFKALGDTTRLKILKIIAATGNNLCVGSIACRLGVSQPAVSQHLKILKAAGLVEADRKGFHVHYQIPVNCLADYGIKTDSFLQSFGAELNLENECELKNNPDQCHNKIEQDPVKGC